MKTKINVVIVDDLPMYANTISSVLIKKNRNATDVEYIPFVFSEDSHFNDASNFIKDKLSDVDIIFSDYYLVGGNGLTLFDIFKEKSIKPYRILHSHTAQRFSEHSREFLDNRFDDFCRTKDETEIEVKLSYYEKNILPIKLMGNPLFYTAYYDKQFQPKEDALRKVGEFTIMDIMSITTKDDNHKIIFRQHAEDRIIISNAEHTGLKYRQGAIIEDAEGMAFARLNQSQLVNLLWVSEIDEHRKMVKFIGSNSLLRKMDIFNFSKEKPYRQTYAQHLQLLSGGIPRFFL